MKLQEVKIELTNYCKRECIHCSSNASTQNIHELPLETVFKIIDESASMGVKTIILTGGEATEYINLDNVLIYAKEKGIPHIKLYSMCEPTAEKLRKIIYYHEIGLEEIIYSLSFSLTTDRAINSQNCKPFLKRISTFMPLSFHYCLTSKTLNDLEKIEEILKSIPNFKNLNLLRFVPHGRGTNELLLSAADLKRIKPKIVSLIEKYPNKIHLGSPFNILDITHTPCSAGSSTMIIGNDGTSYPCDAMKYFNYLGSGGNIQQKSLNEIYNSKYFEQVRTSTEKIEEKCQKCVNKNCQGGCLGQKIIESMQKGEDPKTVKWYQENAMRTLNNFGSKELLKLNGYMGLIGEYGEFFDYIKKLYTHNLTEEKKQEIKKLAPKELGDVMWYIATSLAIYYDYTLENIYDRIKGENTQIHEINEPLLNKIAKNSDPLCPFSEKKSYTIDDINQYIREYSLENSDIFTILMEFKKYLNALDYAEDREKVLDAVARIVKCIAEISHNIFGRNLSEILEENIDKLRIRYPEGFDEYVANKRIDANKNYKEEDETKVKNLEVFSR